MNSITNGAQAAVVIAGIVAVACVVISFLIAMSGSKFPWEK